MIESIKPNMQQPLTLSTEPVHGQKFESLNEIPRAVVDRKQETSSAREEIPREEVEKAIEKLNRLMGIVDKRMEFRIHEESHRVMVKIVDRETGDVIKEIPSKKILDMLGSFYKMAGVLLDKHL